MKSRLIAVYTKIGEKIKKLNDKLSQSDKIGAVICLVVLVSALLPLYSFGRYTIPLADDYSMIMKTHTAWVETHSVWQVILAGLDTTKEFFFSWAGTFSGTFIQTILPGLGDYHTYYLASWILITFFVAATFYFCRVLLCDMLQAKTTVWIILSTLLTLYQIEYLPAIYDAFYWYVGAAAYTFSYLAKLVLVGILLSALQKNKKGKLWQLILFGIYTVFCGGLDYGSTSMPLVILLFLMLIYVLWNKRHSAYIITAVVCYYVSWIITVIAPGNFARQASVGEQNGVIYSIIQSLFTGARYISGWTTAMLLLFTLFMLPFIIHLVKKAELQFKHPVWVLIWLYGMFSAQFTPRIFANYGSGEDVVGYTLNFTHCLFVLFWFLYVIYLTGWIVNTVVKQGDQWNLNYIAYYGTVVITAAVLIRGVYTIESFTSARIALCQYYGYAQNYMSAMLEREQILQQSEGQEVVLPASEMPVPSTGGGDISTDQESWVNKLVAEYYDLKSVRKE